MKNHSKEFLENITEIDPTYGEDEIEILDIEPENPESTDLVKSRFRFNTYPSPKKRISALDEIQSKLEELKIDKNAPLNETLRRSLYAYLVILNKNIEIFLYSEHQLTQEAQVHKLIKEGNELLNYINNPQNQEQNKNQKLIIAHIAKVIAFFAWKNIHIARGISTNNTETKHLETAIKSPLFELYLSAYDFDPDFKEKCKKLKLKSSSNSNPKTLPTLDEFMDIGSEKNIKSQLQKYQQFTPQELTNKNTINIQDLTPLAKKVASLRQSLEAHRNLAQNLQNNQNLILTVFKKHIEAEIQRKLGKKAAEFYRKNFIEDSPHLSLTELNILRGISEDCREKVQKTAPEIEKRKITDTAKNSEEDPENLITLEEDHPFGAFSESLDETLETGQTTASGILYTLDGFPGPLDDIDEELERTA